MKKSCKIRSIKRLSGTSFHEAIFKDSIEKRLRLASSTNNITKVRELIDLGVNVNSYDDNFRTPLHLAASRGYADIVECLLNHNANPNVRDSIGNTPLHLAACTNNLAVVTLLLKHGATADRPDARGHSPLQLAQSRLRLLARCLKSSSLTESESIKAQVQSVIDALLTSLGSDRATQLQKQMTGVTLEERVAELLLGLDELSL